MLVKSPHHTARPSGVLRVEGHRRPVDVPYDQTPSGGAQRAVHLSKRDGGIGEVLEHLDAQRSIDARVRHGQRCGVGVVELDVVGVLTAPLG